MNETRREVVHLDRITKRFGDTVALQELDMKIGAGEFVTFLGPSGCGKSTTLRILGGFETPNEGRVILGGQDVTDTPPNRRNVNMVFQDYALFPHMTVAQNIAFGLELKGLGKAAIATKVGELLNFMELGNYGERLPDQLSGGQRQRVALARALAPDPELLLLDEPLGALDAKLRSQLQVELKDIQRRTGKTFFFVTHDQEEALTMSDRVVVMNDGRVEQDGTPEDLYLRPRNRFVAEFVGETNFLDGTVKSRKGSEITFDWRGVPITGTALNHNPSEGSDVTAALRLEKITIGAKKSDSGNSVRGVIENQLFMGSRTAVDLRINGAGDALLKAYVDPEVAAQVNSEEVWLSWDNAHLSVLQD